MYIILLFILSLLWVNANAANVTVEIEGVSGEQLKNTQAFLSIYKESQSPIDLKLSRINQLHRQAPKEIKNALQPFGYYQVEVKKKLQQTESGWRVGYDISLGEPVRVNQVEFMISGAGQKEPEFVNAINKFPLQRNSILRHDEYESAKQNLMKIAVAKGYLQAKFKTHDVKVDLEKSSADIHLHFETGPQFLFGEVIFVQEGEQLDEIFLKRFLPFKIGDPYNTISLLELQTALSDSDHFSRIEIHQLFDKTENLLVPIEISVTPRKRRRYRFGLGYGTDSGARASVEHQRRVSPKGHVLTLKGNTSEHINRVDMNYAMPLKKPASEQLTMNTHYLEQRTESRQTYAGALDLRRITGWKTWRQAIALTYEREDYRVADETGSSQLLMPNFDLIYNKYNDRIYPTNGLRLTGVIWLSHEVWRSDVDFLQVRVSGKWIKSPIQNGRLIFKIFGGGTLVEGIDVLPASKRFYAGGDQSIRGYDYEELGPEDADGDVIGGKYLAVAGVEYEHRIKTQWGIALFYDLGNSFNNLQEKIYRGVGIGGRWRSKVGPIRLDLGWPLDKTVKYPRFHLVMGLDL